MFLNFWIISTVVCWISIFIYVIIVTHKAKKIYVDTIKKSISECIFVISIVLLLYSVPFFNVIFLAIILNQDMDDLILTTAKKNNWELKDKDDNDKTESTT